MCCVSQHLCFVLFLKLATYAPNIMQAHLSYSASKRCIFLRTHYCKVWLQVWLVLVYFYWYTEKMNTRYLFVLFTFSLNQKQIQIFIKVDNMKGVYKLYSPDENTAALHYVLRLLESSQSGVLCFSLFSHCRAINLMQHLVYFQPQVQR